MRSSFPRVTAWLAALYPIALLVVVLLLRVGERWWLTELLLYVPRVAFALPLVVLVPVLVAQGLRRWLWTQAAAFVVLLFPLLGFVLPHGRTRAQGPSIRLLSYNVNSCKGGYQALADAVLARAPDVVVMQEFFCDARPLVALLAAKYPTIDVTEQFVMASRFPLRAKTQPPVVTHFPYLNVPHVVRYELSTPLGPLAVVTLHPVSVHPALRDLRSLLSGSTKPVGFARTVELIDRNTETREFEFTAALELAASAGLPVVIAGDTNVPNSSPLLARASAYEDGFESADWGFGYTFSSRFAWLRLDRVFVSHELAFTDFDVDCGRASDHRCVTADIARRAE
jgi:endonuclease/exonuclease/phosphatase (EEP) superfamily protein YafD